MNNNILRDLLLREKIIDEIDLFMAEEHLKGTKKTLVDVLYELGFCNEIDLLKLVNKSLDLNIEVKEEYIEILEIFNEEKIKTFHHKLKYELAIKRSHIVLDYNGYEVIILTSNLDNESERNNTKNYYLSNCNLTTRFTATTHYNFMRLVKKSYDNIDYSKYLLEIMELANYNDKLGLAVNFLIEHASIDGASDIFIQYNKEREKSYIFFRIKRNKSIKYVLDTQKMEKVITHIFNKGNMEVGKISGHQDGSLLVPILDEKYDVNLRLNSISTKEGSQLTMRLQEKIMKLKDVGFDEDDYDYIKQTLYKLKGIILMVGPTGSGKTTTMYAMLNEFNPFRYNFLTLENPVEIRKLGLNQIEINDLAGQSFGESVRASLRQAPDGILLGEIRDNETAEIAMEIANTGHLVFATIHANSVDSVKDRLIQLGVKNYQGFLDSMSCCIYQELRNKDNKYFLGYQIQKDDKKIKRVKLD